MARTRHDPPDDEEDSDEGYEADDFGEDEYDPDDPETYPSGLYADDGPPMVPCPNCKADVLEDSERCPSCGNYLSKEDAPSQSRNGPWMILVLLALLAVLVMIFGG